MLQSNWINQVIDECEHVETPRSWLWWSLCCSISAAAGNNYYLKTLKGAVIFKPNIYVILLGESGLGKEFPISLAIKLVSKADVTRVIAGRSSIQAIIQELGNINTREKKGPIEDSRGFIVNGEMSTAIIKDPMALTVLTDLYDNKDDMPWVNLLKGDGPRSLKNPYITALFGSSPSHFYDTIPQINIDGGYVGRNLIDFQEKRYKDTDLFIDEDEISVEGFPFQKFVGHLEKISLNKGRIIPDLDAKEYFNTWRRKWREDIVSNTDKTGFINRVPGHVLKIAICLSLARTSRFDLLITQNEMEEAVERVTALVYANKRASEGKSDIDPLAAVTKLVLDLLLQAPDNEMRRKSILNSMYTRGIADAAIVDKVTDNLIERGWLGRDRIVAGSATDWNFKLLGEPLAQYSKFIKNRMERVK